MPKKLRKRLGELSGNFNEDTVNIKTGRETIKRNQSEVKNTIIEIKNN